MLEDGTPIKLRISRTVSSADAHVGDTVDFEVLEEVRVGNLLLVPKGGTAWATVTEAEAKKRMARGGKLNMNIDSVRLVNGEKVVLRAVKEVKGGGHTGAMTGGMVATAIVSFRRCHSSCHARQRHYDSERHRDNSVRQWKFPD